MIKRNYTEYQIYLDNGIMLRVSLEHTINQITFQEVFANGEVSEDYLTLPADKISELAEIVNDIKAGL